MSIPLPTSIPILMGQDLNNGQKDVLQKIMAGQSDPVKNLLDLGQHWKVKVWFTKPVQLRLPRHYTKKKEEDGTISWGKKAYYAYASEHTFNGFFLSNNQLCYKFKKTGRSGWYFPIEDILKYEPLPASSDAFSGYEEFKRKFDLKFITEDEILSLWKGTSAQHGGKYLKSDFKSISTQGRKVMTRFLQSFQGIDKGGMGTPGYMERKYEDKTYYILEEHHYTTRHPGRDIRISHQTNRPSVYYSSEFAGCGNGTYGLVANKNEYLWLEND
jgi:hypothetical protein